MATIIDANDFHDGRGRIVFEACRAVLDAHGVVDVVLVHEHLCETGLLSEIGGPLTLEWYCAAVAHAAHAEHYARVVAKNAIRRAVYHAARDLAIAAHEAHESIDALRDRAHAIVKLLDARTASLRPIDRERGGLV
jgi:replicative DNA helicase